MLKKLFGASIIYAIGPQLPKVVGFLLLPFITPFLTDIDFGVWGTIIAYSMIFSALRDLGLVVPMINSFFKNPTRWKWVWRQIYYFLIVYGVLFTVVQLIVLYLIMPAEVSQSNKFQILALIGIQSLLFDIPVSIGTRYYQISERPIPVSLIAFITGIIAIVTQYISVVNLKLGYMSWFYATFISMGFAGICYSFLIHKINIYPIPTIRMNWLKPRLKVALPLVPHNYSSYLLNASDRVIMNWFKVSTGNIGIYNIAYMWGNYMDLVGGAVGTAAGPYYYKYFREKTEESLKNLKKFNYFLQVSFIIGAFIIALWTKDLFYILIRNEELKKAYPLAVIIIMGYCYRPMYWLIVNRLQFEEKTADLWKISLVGGLINVILNVLFIPIFGFKAAAFTTFVALMYIGFSGFYIPSFKKIDTQNYHPIKWLGLICLLTLLAYLSQDLSWMLKAAISGIVLLPTIVVLKKLI